MRIKIGAGMNSSETEYKKYLHLIIRKKGLFIKVALSLMTVIFVISYLLPKKYQATSTVFIEKNVISELVKGITVAPSMDDSIRVLTYAITSRNLLNKTLDHMPVNFSRNPNIESEALIKELQRNITVKVKDKDLFTITFINENPRIARDFVNTLVNRYIEENTSAQRGESYGASEFLKEQIENFKEKMEKAETKLNDYKQEKGGVIAVEETKLYEGISTAEQKLYDLQLQRRQLEGMRQVTRKSSDPLNSKMGALEKRLEELRIQYTDSYPEILKIKSDIETLRDQMKTRSQVQYQSLDQQELDKINAEIDALKITEASLQRYIASNRALLRNLPTAKAGLEKLELEHQNQKNIYDQLHVRQSQSEVSKEMALQDKSTTFRVVDPAVLPVKPFSPNRLKIMLMGIAGSVAAAFGLLMLLDQMDNTVKDLNFLKGLGVPVLAVISRVHIQQEADEQAHKTKLLLSVSGVYLLILLCFPLMELLGLDYVDKLINLLNPVDAARSIVNMIR